MFKKLITFFFIVLLMSSTVGVTTYFQDKANSFLVENFDCGEEECNTPSIYDIFEDPICVASLEHVPPTRYWEILDITYAHRSSLLEFDQYNLVSPPPELS